MPITFLGSPIIPISAGPDNAYVEEDATTFYVAEDGTTFYVQES
jgi:hypothetical protein